MRILTRYILREVVTYALLGGVLFTFVLFTRYLLPLLELMVRGAVTPVEIGRVIVLLLPNLMMLTLPMAVLIGILLGLSRLGADSEITAMRAAGMGVQNFLGIVSIFALAAFAVALFNGLYAAPKAAAALLRFEDARKTEGIAFELQPRVFYEDIKNYVVYVQDVRPGQGETLWRHVFVADLTQPATPYIVTADQGYITAEGSSLRLHLNNGSRHGVSPNNANQYDISTFASSELPIQTTQQEDAHITRRDTPIQSLPLGTLRQLGRQPGPAGRPYAIEMQRRFAFPFACLVLMFVGVPLGFSSSRGGKGAGFVLTIILVFLYYFVSSVGIALATQGKIPVWFGVWAANISFTLVGLVLVQQLARGGAALYAAAGLAQGVGRRLQRPERQGGRWLRGYVRPRRRAGGSPRASSAVPTDFG